DDSTEVPVPATGLPPPGEVTRRLVTAGETLYLDATLAAPRPLRQSDALGLVFENYELAFTPELVADAYGGRVTDPMLVDAGDVPRGDAAWWVPSGRHLYLGDGEAPATARDRFFAVVGHRDALGALTTVGFHGDTWLLTERVEDAAGNVTRVDAFDLYAL